MTVAHLRWAIAVLAIGILTLLSIATVEADAPTGVAPAEGGDLRYCADVPLNIPDGGVNWTEYTIPVSDSVTISDLNVLLTTTHPWVSDLEMRLRHGSSGDGRPLFQVYGPAFHFSCAGDDLPGITLNDEGNYGNIAHTCTSGNPAYTPGMHYNPVNPLTPFDGENTQGFWTLRVRDIEEGYTGTVEGWCIEFNSPDTLPPTPTPTPTPLPGDPAIQLTPAAFYDIYMVPGQVHTETMTIQNVSGGKLNWTILESDPPAPQAAGNECPPLQNIGWLTVSPSVGMTPGQSSSPVTLTFNSAGFPVDNYRGEICIRSNDPETPDLVVPVVMLLAFGDAVTLGDFRTAPPPLSRTDLALAGGLLAAGTLLWLRRRR